jgi:hypothetical protein
LGVLYYLFFLLIYFFAAKKFLSPAPTLNIK